MARAMLPTKRAVARVKQLMMSEVFMAPILFFENRTAGTATCTLSPEAGTFSLEGSLADALINIKQRWSPSPQSAVNIVRS